MNGPCWSATLDEHYEIAHLGLGVKPDDGLRAAIWTQCVGEATRHLDAENLEPVGGIERFERLVGDRWDCGVHYTVAVGRQLDRGEWTWSARWEHWRGWFASMGMAASASALAGDGDVGGPLLW